jgi:4-amino-4-deoxy-L-arabinose transferase-like glycosyltransferase
LRFIHLDADFPRHYTKSGALYTDEGAYSGAAVACLLTGNWHIDGDFNPAASLPVFHIAQYVSFKLFGLSLESARRTELFFFVLLLLALYLLISHYQGASVAFPVLVVVCVNFNTFVYSRVAFLEIPMCFFVVLSLWLAARNRKRNQLLFSALAATAFMLGVFTKTIAVFAFPLLIFVILTKPIQPREKRREIGMIAAVSFGILLLYYLILAKPYWADVQLYYSTNIYSRTQTSPGGMIRAVARAIFYGYRIGTLLYIQFIFSAVYLLWQDRGSFREPLLWLAIFWYVFYLGLIASQDYVPPRYYTPLVVPAAIPPVMAFARVLRERRTSRWAWVIGIAIAACVLFEGVRIVRTAETPQYSWREMAQSVKQRIAADVGDLRDAVVLSRFGSSIALSTGIFSITEHLGTISLAEKIDLYQPDYYICLGEIKADIGAVLQQQNLDAVRLASYDVFDNYYTGEPVTLYRLQSK